MENTLNFKVSRIHRINGEGSLRAFIDLSINDSILLKGISIIEGKNGLFVSMPREQGKDKRWYDTIRCLSKDVRNAMSHEIMAVYEKEDE